MPGSSRGGRGRVGGGSRAPGRDALRSGRGVVRRRTRVHDAGRGVGGSVAVSGALRDLVGLLPQLAGLVARLAADGRVPARAKAALAIVAVALASPVDLIPDFLPGLGYLDDAVLVAIVLDGLLNHVDREIVRAHWPGDAASLDRAARLAARLAAWVPRRWKARVFGPQRGR